jgi:hypothetical protein
MDAAKRQLETVIRLYFSNGDPVSIHTLTAAAYNIIRDVNKKRGGRKMLAKDGFLDYIKEGHEKEVRELLNKAENFFKHADRDSTTSIDFNPEQSEFLIGEACSFYYSLTGEFPPLFKIYQIWFVVNHPNYFNFPDEQKRQISMGAQEVLALGRAGFLAQALPAFTRINT